MYAFHLGRTLSLFGSGLVGSMVLSSTGTAALAQESVDVAGLSGWDSFLSFFIGPFVIFLFVLRVWLRVQRKEEVQGAKYILRFLAGLLAKFRLLLKEEPKRMPKMPKGEDDYRSERGKIHEHYLREMDNYDKRLLWASGGAFVVSFTALQFLSGQQDFQQMPGSEIYLLIGWGFLVLSVIIEVGAPYASTRIFVRNKTALIALYEDGDDNAAKIETAKSEAWGRLTKLANEGAYVSLLLGFYYIAVYIFWNLPS